MSVPPTNEQDEHAEVLDMTTPGGLGRATYRIGCRCGWQHEPVIGLAGYRTADAALRAHLAARGAPLPRTLDDATTEELAPLGEALASLLLSAVRNLSDAHDEDES